MCNIGCAVYTMVKLRLNALIGIFLLLADEGHTIALLLIFDLSMERQFWRSLKMAKVGQSF